MDLAQELRDQIDAFIEGREPIGTLRDWLDLHVEAIEDAGVPELDVLTGNLWALLAELDYGHRSETDLRVDLRGHLLTADNVPTHGETVRRQIPR